MPSTPEYALMAANAYAVKSDVTSIQNAIPLPAGWTSLNIDAIDDSTGFTNKKGQRRIFFERQAHAVM